MDSDRVTKKENYPNDGATPAKARSHHENRFFVALGTSMSSSREGRYARVVGQTIGQVKINRGPKPFGTKPVRK